MKKNNTPKYNINRKYSLEGRGGGKYEMLDIGVVEDERTPEEILIELDNIANMYAAKQNSDKNNPYNNPYKDYDFKPKEGTNPSIASNWIWQKKPDTIPPNSDLESDEKQKSFQFNKEEEKNN